MKHAFSPSEIAHLIRLARESGDAWGIMNCEEPIIIDYTNWRGERSFRTIIPESVYWGRNEFHKDPQWLMEAWDVEKQAKRTFALLSIHSFGVPNTDGKQPTSTP